MEGARIRALTAQPPIKPTSTRCHSARQPNLGRGSTYRRGKSVQTTGTTSINHAVQQTAACGGTLEFAALERNLAERTAELGRLRDRLLEREVAIFELQATVSAMRMSTSWRMTAPLRACKRVLVRLSYTTIGFPILLACRALTCRSLAPLANLRTVRNIRRSGLFDSSWYRASNPDVAAFGIDPIRHYVLFGAQEERDPSPSFNSRAYTARWTDDISVRENPLLHSISHQGIRIPARRGYHRLFSPKAIAYLAKQLNDRNLRKAIVYVRRGQLRFVFARARDLLIMAVAANGKTFVREHEPAPTDRSRENRPRSQHEPRSTLPNSNYLTLHPELVSSEKIPLDASVSVVIPTYNGGPEFFWLIRKLKEQKGLRSIEIIIVDSGSNDDTDSVARDLNCKVIQIPKNDFSHSFSRNRGAEEATGDLILFMVQDAYPIGDYWLYGLASCLLQSRATLNVSALSCAEYSRYDSELLYDYLIQTHCAFLGCRNSDRVGTLSGDSHIELRIQGQLSDIACLIYRDVFEKYRFIGRYAEDLTLGIRLIRDHYRVAMLSSIPVIHAHRRSRGYYLRRVFVDVTFLAEVFPDFISPQLGSIRGTLAAALALDAALPKVHTSAQIQPGDALQSLIAEIERLKLPSSTENLSGRGDFGFSPFGVWIEKNARSGQDHNAVSVEQSISHFKAMFVSRLVDIHTYVVATYPALDDFVASEINNAIEKTLAMTLGAQMAFHYLTAKSGSQLDTDLSAVSELRDLLLEGI